MRSPSPRSNQRHALSPSKQATGSDGVSSGWVIWNVVLFSKRLNTEPQIMLASSQTTSPAWESVTSASSRPRKPAPTTRASFMVTLTRNLPEGLPWKCRSAVSAGAPPSPSGGTVPSALASTDVKHIVSITSSTADASAVWISFGSMDHPQAVFDLFPQGFWREGLRDISLRPQREHLLDAVLGPVRGHHQDRDQMQHFVSGHPPQQLFAVHSGHVDVGEHRIHPVVFEQPQCLLAIRGLQATAHLQAGQFQYA